MTGDTVSPLRNGRIGMINNMNIHVSNNVLSTTDGGTTVWYMLFGHPLAISFAEQLVQTRAIQAPDTFGYYISGLHVYGYDVVKPEALGYLYAAKG